MRAGLYVVIPTMALLAVLQAVILPRFPVAGVEPQLLFLIALAWGLLRGLEEGAVWAFVAGLWVDLFSVAPLGLSSFAFVIAVAVSVLLQRALPPRRLLGAIVLAIVGTLIYLAIYGLVLHLFGLGTIASLIDLLPIVLMHAFLIAPIYLALQGILRAFRPRPVEI